MDDAERVQVAHLGAGVGARLRRRLSARAVAGRYERRWGGRSLRTASVICAKMCWARRSEYGPPPCRSIGLIRSPPVTSSITMMAASGVLSTSCRLTTKRCEPLLRSTSTWGGTVRGTYPTPEAGTRTPYVQVRGALGQAALCVRYVPNAGGWYA